MKPLSLVFLVSLLTACRAERPGSRPDLLQSSFDSLVPAPFTDCGHATRESAERVLTCTCENLAAQRPFVASFLEQGIDSEIVIGLASAAPGEIVRVWFDSDPSGGGNVGARIHFVEPCPQPIFQRVNGLVMVECQ